MQTVQMVSRAGAAAAAAAVAAAGVAQSRRRWHGLGARAHVTCCVLHACDRAAGALVWGLQGAPGCAGVWEGEQTEQARGCEGPGEEGGRGRRAAAELSEGRRACQNSAAGASGTA